MNVAIEGKKAVLIVVAVLGLAAALLVVRPILLGPKDETTAAPPATTLPRTPVTPAKPTPARPRLLLLPGLPKPVDHGLRSKQVVVVALTVGHQATGPLFGQARKGAHAAGAGFVTLDLTRERNAQSTLAFAGADTSGGLLVVQRPGKIVNRFEGYVDSAIVAQAAVNAGAHPPKATAEKADAKAKHAPGHHTRAAAKPKSRGAAR